jgi:hypothetical protein
MPGSSASDDESQNGMKGLEAFKKIFGSTAITQCMYPRGDAFIAFGLPAGKRFAAMLRQALSVSAGINPLPNTCPLGGGRGL